MKQEANPIIPALLPQEVHIFKPTLGMEKWLDTAINLASDSPTEISSESGLSKTNWYEWLKLPDFEDWYYESYKNKRKRWLPSLDAMGMKHAKAGKYDFWKDMNKKAGEDLGQKQDNNIQVNVLNAVQDQKTKYGI